MAILKIAADFDQFECTTATVTGDTANFDSQYTDRALTVTSRNDSFPPQICWSNQGFDTPAGNSLWVHWEEKWTDNNNWDGFAQVFRDNTGAEIARLDITNGDRRLYILATNTNYGSLLVNVNQRAIIDIEFDVSDPVNYVVRFYASNAPATTPNLLATATFAKGARRLPSRCELWAIDTGSSYISQFIVADEDTRKMRLHKQYRTAAGNYAQGVGSIMDIATTGYYGPNPYFTAAGQRQSAVFDYGGPQLGSIVAVAIGYRGISGIGAPTPTTMRPFARIGGTDYDQGSPVNFNVQSQWQDQFMTVNPATGAAWTYGDITGGSLELGVLSG